MALQLLGQTYSIAVKFVGLPGELRFDSSNWDLLLDDGVVPGGHRFLNQDNSDQRYQAKSPELDGLLGFEPQNRGILVRRGPSDYRVRELKVNGDNMTLEESKGYGGNPTFSLKPTIESDHTWAGKQTFEQAIKGNEGFEGDLTGDVTGDVVGDLTGDSTGKHTGSLDTSGGTVDMAEGQIELAWLAAAIQQRLCPVGSILIWSGAANAIPAGWKLCNGGNGTPDLTDRFVVGAGNQLVVGATGGDAEVTPELTIPASGAHTHAGAIEIATTGITIGKIDYPPVAGGGSQKVYRDLAFNDPGHKHDLSMTPSGEHTHTVTAEAFSILPPYYALCYIMKVN